MRKHLLVAVAAALGIPCGVLAATTTTAPSKAVLVRVTITDSGIRTALLSSDTANGAKEYWAAYYGIRGEIAYFVVQNKGKKPHNFAILGRKTKTISPGGKARFHLALVKRGKFRYASTVDAGRKGFSGVFTVA